MKRIKQVMGLLLAAPLVCVVLAGSALAARENALWAQLDQTSGKVSAVLEASAPVTDGTIQVTFNPDKLTYVSCDFTGTQEQYKPHVAMHAVNDAKAGEGVVRIAWVAPDAGAVSGEERALFQVNFQAKGDVAPGDLSISGTANAANGGAVTVVQDPAQEPTVPPTAPPTAQPSTQPTVSPSVPPTLEPTAQPTPAGTAQPTQTPAAPAGDHQQQGSQEELPPTGDHAQVGLFVALAVASAAALAGAGLWSKNRRGV